MFKENEVNQMTNAQENKPIKEILSDGEFIYFEWDYGDLEDYPEDCIVWVPKSAYLSVQAENEKLKDANKKLREVIERHHNWHLQSKEICIDNEFTYDMSAEYVDSGLCEITMVALSEASDIEGGS